MKKLILMLVALVGQLAFANDPPVSFTYQGKLFKANGIDPVESSSVSLKIQVRSPDGLCVLFEETHMRDMTGTGGVFSIMAGEGSNTGATSLSLSQVFDNLLPKMGQSGCTYVPASGDGRRIRFSYTDGADTVVMPTDQQIRSVPYALYAMSLQGLSKDKFIQVSAATTQAKADAIFNVTNQLLALAAGTSGVYAKAADLPMSGGVLQLGTTGVKVADIPLQGDYAVNRNYVDARFAGRVIDLTGLSDGQTIVWNTTTNNWTASPLTQGTVKSISAGTGLLGGVITGNGTIGLAPVGTSGVYSKVMVDAYGRITSGSGLSESDIPTVTTPGKISGSVLTSGTIGGSTAVSTSGPITTTGVLTAAQMTSNSVTTQSLRIFNTANTYKVTMTAPTNLASDYTFVLPPAPGATGQLLTTDGSGNLAWIAQGSLAYNLTGPAGGDMSGNFPNPTVSKLNGVAVSSTTPSVGQVMRYSSGSYAPAYIALSDLKNNLGNSQIANNCSGNQALIYNSVTDSLTCNTITLSASDIPNISWSKITSGLPTTLSGYGVTLAASDIPSIPWSKISSGTPTTLSGYGVTLAAGDIPSLPWSKISSGLPTSLSGYGITDSVSNAGNVQSLQSGTFASRPAASASSGRVYFATDVGQISMSNGTTWTTLASVATSGLTSLTAGTGMVGGTVTSTGTIAVDVGTTAGKIVQVDSNGKLPAIDASNLTNTPGMGGVQVFDSSGTFTVPAGIKKVYVTAWGSGGGGAGGGGLVGGGGGGGGAGAYGEKLIVLSNSDPVTVTVGAAGTAGPNGAAGGNGNSSSFGSYLVVAGGAGGTAAGTLSVLTAAPAAADHGLAGQPGAAANAGIGGEGGAAFGGYNAPGSTVTTAPGSNGMNPGCGGGGGSSFALGIVSGGGAGAKGRVMVRW